MPLSGHRERTAHIDTEVTHVSYCRPSARSPLIASAVVLSLVLAVFAFPVLAIEVSSKRDCVVCHVMWMDDFRTDKETLIEWQPGNVLMQDTQGVVSSEDICYSCHDGYVNDSRAIAWKFNRHPTFVKPSNNVTIPSEFPLSVKSELYCGTCHSAHGKGAAPHGDPTGMTSVFRETNIDSGLCENCHRNEAAYKYSNSHPLHTAEIRLPERLFGLGAKKAKDKNQVICQSCHKIHGARGEKILIVDNKNSDLCVICHEKQKNVVGSKHDLRLTLPEEKNVKGQLVTTAGPCGACHTAHNAAAKRLWARKPREGNPASEMCLTCHGENTEYNTKRIGDYSHPIDTEPGSKTKVPDSLPLFFADGTKSPAGKVQCFTCHDVHVWDPDSPDQKGGKDIEGDSSNSFLRIANSSSSRLCMECHIGKKQLLVSDHNLEITAPDEKNVQGFTTAVAGPCGACHVPHNAAAPHIWARDPYGAKDFVTQLCTGCHNHEGIAKEKDVGDNYHPVDVTLERFDISTNLPLYDDRGYQMEDGKVVCITCHDPHIWDPTESAVVRTAKNIEGDASNSFLRKPNWPSSELCGSCHEDKKFIDGTDHDLSITASSATNILGQTPRQSGPCGVCHLVHRSPNTIKLWGRPYGPISEAEDIVNALCTSCHSKGNLAEGKVPAVATHPEDKLISNVLRSDRSAIDFSPIYDKKTGEETHVGNISCPSCHDAHQWNPLVKKKGDNKNLEGNATNSFLRNVSYNNICIDCHGLDALFRYKYFHDPKERADFKRRLFR